MLNVYEFMLNTSVNTYGEGIALVAAVDRYDADLLLHRKVPTAGIGWVYVRERKDIQTNRKRPKVLLFSWYVE